LNKKYPKNGVFGFQFHDFDEKVTITIDDQLPINEGTNKYYMSFGRKRIQNADISEGGAWW